MSTYNPAYQKRWLYDRHRGVPRSTIPADTIRDHLQHLTANGHSLRAIGDTAHVSPTVISRVIAGKTGELQRPVAARLLAVTPRKIYDRPNAAGFVPKIGAVRRTHALYAIGWTGDHVNTAADKPRRFAQNILNQPGDWITLDSWRAIARAYDELSMTLGPSDTNRRRAARNGWAPPLAWDDETIDDPTATPFVDHAAGRRPARRAPRIHRLRPTPARRRRPRRAAARRVRAQRGRARPRPAHPRRPRTAEDRMRHALQCLPDCDGWPCECHCHDDPRPTTGPGWSRGSQHHPHQPAAPQQEP